MARNFKEWLLTFTNNIADYKYYIDFETTYKNVESYKLELNMMSALIGSKNIEDEFEEILKRYPEVLKCIPILLATRQNQIDVLDDEGNKFEYDFTKFNYNIEQYKIFMRETGLFNLMQNHLINNMYDYVLGVEVGLNSNARKNRGGLLMENLVEKFIQKAGFKKNETYFKEMYIQDIENKWNLDISHISNNTFGRRFDFVVKTDEFVYIIETNYYSSSGNKLCEVAKEYEKISEKIEKIDGVKFVWITDGIGWFSARNCLQEAFNHSDNIYNINDMKNGVMKEMFK